MTIDRERLRELAAAATTGPWQPLDHSHYEPGCRCLSHFGPATVWQLTPMIDCEDVPRNTTDPTDSGERCEVAGFRYDDAAFIAACDPDTIRGLLDENERLRAAVAALVEAERHHNAADPEVCWRCERPWPCPAEQAAADVRAALDGTE